MGLETFTDRNRKVWQLAKQESQRFHLGYVDTEHILLGLVQEGSGIAANILMNLGIDLRKIRLEVEKIAPIEEEIVYPLGGPSAHHWRSKKVIEFTIEEARQLRQDDRIGTEHLLLGLLREQEGIAAQVLMSFGLGLNLVRWEVLKRRCLPMLAAIRERGVSPAAELASAILAGDWAALPVLADALEDADDPRCAQVRGWAQQQSEWGIV